MGKVDKQWKSNVQVAINAKALLFNFIVFQDYLNILLENNSGVVL